MTRDPAAPVMPERPVLAPWCRVVEDGRRVLVEHGGTVVTLEGRAATALLPRLLPLLDGSRTTEQVVAELGVATRPAVTNALELLAAHRLLTAGPLAGNGDAAAVSASYAASLSETTTQSEARRRLMAHDVVVLGSGSSAEAMARTLRGSGVAEVRTATFDDTRSDAALVVAVPEPAEVGALAAVNDRALARGSSWLQVLPYDGRFVVAGPLFIPGVSACRSCWVSRRAACSGFEGDYELVASVAVRAPFPEPLSTIGVALAAVIALRWLAIADPGLPGRYYSLEARSVVQLRFDRLLRVPRCPSCGPPSRAVPSPWFEVA